MSCFFSAKTISDHFNTSNILINFEASGVYEALWWDSDNYIPLFSSAVNPLTAASRDFYFRAGGPDDVLEELSSSKNWFFFRSNKVFFSNFTSQLRTKCVSQTDENMKLNNKLGCTKRKISFSVVRLLLRGVRIPSLQ